MHLGGGGGNERDGQGARYDRAAETVLYFGDDSHKHSRPTVEAIKHAASVVRCI